MLCLYRIRLHFLASFWARSSYLLFFSYCLHYRFHITPFHFFFSFLHLLSHFLFFIFYFVLRSLLFFFPAFLFLLAVYCQLISLSCPLQSRFRCFPLLDALFLFFALPRLSFHVRTRMYFYSVRVMYGLTV